MIFPHPALGHRGKVPCGETLGVGVECGCATRMNEVLTSLINYNELVSVSASKKERAAFCLPARIALGLRVYKLHHKKTQPVSLKRSLVM